MPKHREVINTSLEPPVELHKMEDRCLIGTLKYRQVHGYGIEGPPSF